MSKLKENKIILEKNEDYKYIKLLLSPETVKIFSNSLREKKVWIIYVKEEKKIKIWLIYYGIQLVLFQYYFKK
jgi:hypothetical protein